MTLKAFSIRDLKAGAFNAPFFAPTIGEAERKFTQVGRDPQSNINQFPEDFQLFLVGEFDDASAQYVPLAAPQHLMDATQTKAH